MKRLLVLLVVTLIAATLAASAQTRQCQNVGGVLMTNIALLPYGPEGGTNLGPAFGDLAGSVAATQTKTSPITFQHYWVLTTGDTVTFKPAVLTPTATDDPNVVAVKWGKYRAWISGGTGKYAGATGYIDAFGLADFKARTLVLRYRGNVCYVVTSTSPTVADTFTE